MGFAMSTLGFLFIFLHWYLGDFMKIMFYGQHSKTKKKIVCLASLALALAVAQSETTVICDSL